MIPFASEVIRASSGLLRCSSLFHRDPRSSQVLTAVESNMTGLLCNLPKTGLTLADELMTQTPSGFARLLL